MPDKVYRLTVIEMIMSHDNSQRENTDDIPRPKKL